MKNDRRSFCLSTLSALGLFLFLFGGPVPGPGIVLADERPDLVIAVSSLPESLRPSEISNPGNRMKLIYLDHLIRRDFGATPEGDGAELVVSDCGVGITEENQKRIFEGFFSTQETIAYSSRRPFDFNAGGKGADLLRMKIFAERFGFAIDMASERCGCIPRESDLCPGRIDACGCCQKREDCFKSGGTRFTVYFPRIASERCLPKPKSTLQAEQG